MNQVNNIEEDSVVIFLHIPKTAGTSLRHIVQSQFQPHNVFEFYNLKTQPPKVRKGIEKYHSLSETRKKAIKFVSGHVGFGLHEFLHRPCTYITVLRDPVERVISYYYFLRRNQNSIVEDKNLPEFVQTFSGVHNSMTCYLSGLTLKAQLQHPNFDPTWQFDRQTLETARENLDLHFKVVGFVDKFDETCILLKRILGWNLAFYEKKNVAKRQNAIDSISQETLQLIREHNELDLQLYDYARTKFAEAIEEQGAGFIEDLANFRCTTRSQASYFKIQSSVKRLTYKVYEKLS